METPRINHDQKVYILPAGDGYSCWGFDNAYAETAALAERLSTPDLAPTPEDYGALTLLDKHRALIQAIPETGIGTWFSPKTPEKVRKVLEQARRSGRTLRLFFGDAITGLDWLEENDTVGRIGRSTGRLRIPLLITKDEPGGPRILDANIVRILDVATGKELYRHRSYHQPELKFVEEPGHDFPFVVRAENVVARFKQLGRAARWIAFMTGDLYRRD